MIVVVGPPAWRNGEPGTPAGRTCEVALAAAEAGARAEVVGRIGDDPAGDALLIALAQGGRRATRPRSATRPGRRPVLPAATEPDAGDEACSTSRPTSRIDPPPAATTPVAVPASSRPTSRSASST